MTKVTFHPKSRTEGETPSQTIMRAANEEFTVTDSLGRKIGFKKLPALARMKMFSVIGKEDVTNPAFMSIAAPAFLVSSIDGEPVNRPHNRIALDGLVQRLGDEGIEAIEDGIREHFSDEPETVEEVRNEVKNS